MSIITLNELINTHNITTFLVDASGVLYNDLGPISGIDKAVDYLQSQGNIFITTNNANHNPHLISQNLQTIGVSIPPAQILSSGLGVQYNPHLMQLVKDKTVYVFGKDASHPYLEGSPCKDITPDITQAEVIVMTASLKKKTTAEYTKIVDYLRTTPNTPVICLNPDRVVLGTTGLIHVIGYYAEQLEKELGIQIHWFGKPYENYYEMVRTIVASALGTQHLEEKTCLFDDNLENVIQAQTQLDIYGCWITETGIAKGIDLENEMKKYSYIIKSMPKKEQSLTPSHIFRQHQDDILGKWLSEVKENPHFSKEEFSQNEHLETTTRNFLGQLLSTLETEKLPDLSHKAFEPLFKLWHQTLKDQESKGFSTKDTALLLFSLKTTIMGFIKKWMDNKPEMYISEISKFRNLLDFLALLTFEVFSAEKEIVIERLDHQIEYLQDQQAQHTFKDMISNSPQMEAVYRAIGLILENDITLLLEGESGTGKDLIATIVHQNSKRKNKPFITLNCGAIPGELVESELFGHEKGAFTSAESQRMGKFELADTGTLFLDEVGELPLDTQVKLLRVLQNKEIERVGSSKKIKIDVRIIAATNKDLKTEVSKKRFRKDLFYRLHVYPIEIPPLRERKSDILLLAKHFLTHYSKQFQTRAKRFTKDAQEFLLAHPWEGNVRELENLMQRAAILASGDTVSRAILELKPGKTTPEIPPALTAPQLLLDAAEPERILPLAILEKRAIQQALTLKKGNIQHAAKALGVSRTTFYNKLKKYKIGDEPR